MPIPHTRPGPLSMSTSIRPCPIKLFCLNNTGSSIVRATVAAESSDVSSDLVITQLQELIPDQVGQCRVQYPREYKIGVISYWRNYSQQGLSKYAITKCLHISEKMLRDWIAKESEILSQRKGQHKGTTGRYANLPETEQYL